MWHCLARHTAPPLQAASSAIATPVALRRCFARKTTHGGDRHGITDADVLSATGTSVSVNPNSGLAAFTGVDGQPGGHASTSVSLPLAYASKGSIDQSEARWLWDNETGGATSVGVRAPQQRWRKTFKGTGFEPPGKGKSFASDSEEDDEVMPCHGQTARKGMEAGSSGKGKNRSSAQSDSEEDVEVMPFRGHKAGKSMGFGPSGKGKTRSFVQSDSEEDDEVMPSHGHTTGKGMGAGPSGRGKGESLTLSDSEDNEEVMPRHWGKGKGQRRGAIDLESDTDKVSKPLAQGNRTTGRDSETGHRKFSDSDDDETPVSRPVQGANMQPKGLYSPRGEALRLKARSGSLGRRSYPDSDDEFFGDHKGFGGFSKGSDGGMGFGGVISGKGGDGKRGRFDGMSFASDFGSKGNGGKRKGFDSMDFGAKGQKGSGDSGKEGKRKGFDSMDFGAKGRQGKGDSFSDGKFGKSKGGKDHRGKSKGGKDPGFKGKGLGYF